VSISPGLVSALSIGIRGKDFIVVGSSKRELYGSLIVSEKGSLIRVFDDRVITCFSGHVPDIQYVFREIEWFLRTEQLKRDRELSIVEIARFIGLLLFSYKLFPNIAFGIVGGIEIDNKTKLFDLDPLGSVLEDNYVASGISAEVAYGLLEKEYKPDITFDEGKELVIRTLKSVAKRDVLIGRYADIAYVRIVDNKRESGIAVIKLL